MLRIATAWLLIEPPQECFPFRELVLTNPGFSSIPETTMILGSLCSLQA
jgi:hypothetical protein